MNTVLLPSGTAVNLDAVTHAEPATWRSSQPDGSIPTFVGVIVHFVGGTVLRLTDADNTFIRQLFRIRE